MHLNIQITTFDNCYINPTIDFILFLCCSIIVLLSMIKQYTDYLNIIEYNPILLIEMVATFISYNILCKRYNICL